MCNRFSAQLITLKDGTQRWIKVTFADSEYKFPFGTESFPNPPLPDRPVYYPGYDVFCVSHDGEAVTPEIRIWGNYPPWAPTRIANSKSENIFSSKHWGKYSTHNRCLIPATAFYEWEYETEKIKHNTKIEIAGRESFVFAGIYGEDINPKTKVKEHWCTILTQEANDRMKEIHNHGENRWRQPVILADENLEAWLDPSYNDPEKLSKLINSYPSSWVIATRIPSDIAPRKKKQENTLFDIED
ncbi:SOS response-associated peptidase [Leptospira andrefontaineae]|uniref:Abasic site processing protein n=1 Tax=Leptospira andrefontaineae TaxID=2484976 RepID=A0A4R9GWW0_9LEPT|nr:SOS response-associated peptidase family protein [Leptospira andrefontaineae]TGK36255.1 hypothetical protein EHO65_18310 [Leptospira andrefontaineae]